MFLYVIVDSIEFVFTFCYSSIKVQMTSLLMLCPLAWLNSRSLSSSSINYFRFLYVCDLQIKTAFFLPLQCICRLLLFLFLTAQPTNFSTVLTRSDEQRAPLLSSLS